MLADITPVILTYNESANIGRSLERLTWAREVVIVDSGSTDDTLVDCRSLSQHTGGSSSASTAIPGNGHSPPRRPE